MAVSGSDSGEVHSLISTPSQSPQSGVDPVSASGTVATSRPNTSDQSTSPQNTSRTNKVRQKVLVVDDEEYVRGILRTMLEDLGYESIEASDGDEGLRLFEHARNNFVACIIDLTMPGMAGLELLELIRAQDATVPVLLVSGYARHEVREREARSKRVSFLQKPFTIAQFKSAIDSHLDAA